MEREDLDIMDYRASAWITTLRFSVLDKVVYSVVYEFQSAETHNAKESWHDKLTTAGIDVLVCDIPASIAVVISERDFDVSFLIRHSPDRELKATSSL
jgi:hypothetical protein